MKFISDSLLSHTTSKNKELWQTLEREFLKDKGYTEMKFVGEKINHLGLSRLRVWGNLKL